MKESFLKYDRNFPPAGVGPDGVMRPDKYRFHAFIYPEDGMLKAELVGGYWTECLKFMDEFGPGVTAEVIDVERGVNLPLVGVTDGDMGVTLTFQRIWFNFDDATTVEGVGVTIGPDGVFAGYLPMSNSPAPG